MTLLLRILPLLCLTACSASPGINVGHEPDGSVAGSGGGSGFGGSAGLGGFGGTGNALTAKITEPPSQMAIEVITIHCAGECKQVLAIASGGNDPYTFAWNDGVTTAAREICADDTTTFTVTVNDTAFVDDEFQYEAQTATTSVEARVLSCPSDGGVDSGCDVPAAMPDGLPGTAMVAVYTLASTLDPVMFVDGASLPAGRYRLTYVDGCFMPSFILGWSVNATPDRGVWLVGATSEELVVKAPPMDTTRYATFNECVLAAAQHPPIEFDFPGGPLGLWLNDSPYSDNVEGEGGRNPVYRLEYLCEP